MMTLDQIRERLKDANLRKVAAGAGLPYSRVWRLVSGSHQPMHSTVEALSRYLMSTERVGSHVQK